MKKSVLIIGIGRLGGHLAENMQNLGHDVIALDSKEESINKIAGHFDDARIADYTNEDVLRALDIPSFDLCFITVGDDFEASMITTLLLKKLGAKYVAARARDALAGGYAIFEVPIVKEWKGKTIAELDVRKKYKINIIAIKTGTAINASIMPDYAFRGDEHIFVLGQSRDVFKLSSKT